MAGGSRASSSEIEDFQAESEALSATIREMFCHGGGYLGGAVTASIPLIREHFSRTIHI